MEPVDFFASERQYADHLVPIWHALDPAERGRFFGSSLTVPRLAAEGIDAINALPRSGTRPVVVAAHSDYMRSGARPVVYVEHGAGQRYDGAGHVGHAGYSGGADRERTVLFLCNSHDVAAADVAAYPGVPAEVVGCPKLDPWHGPRAIARERAEPTVAFSFHWDCRVAPEARSALSHYQAALRMLVPNLLAKGWRVLGHGHPKAWARLHDLWVELGAEPTPEFSDVLDQADVYVADNTSTIYEFASTDRPVVLLNAPWYRRDVEHGLRFWREARVGVQVDDSWWLPDAIGAALQPNPEQDAMRRDVVQRVYPLADGQAATRAAAAMRLHLGGRQWKDSPMTAGPDPFAGTRVVRTRSTQRPFPSDRLLRLGATEAEVADARSAWDRLTYDQQENSAAMMEQQTDPELRAAIDADRADSALDQLHAWATRAVAEGYYTDRDSALDDLDLLVAAVERDEALALIGVVQPAATASGGSGTTGTEGTAPTDDEPVGAEPAEVFPLADGYPENGGTIASVLGWVGAEGADNVARARYAEREELALPEKDQRKGVLDAVRKIIGASG